MDSQRSSGGGDAAGQQVAVYFQGAGHEQFGIGPVQVSVDLAACQHDRARAGDHDINPTSVRGAK